MKDTHIQIRLSRAEKHRVEHAAADAGQSLSDYIRERIVPTQPTVSETAAAFLDTDDLERRIKSLQARGLTRPVAEREARKAV